MVKFTKRGAEVFHLYVKGCSGRNIAMIMGMTYSGVRRHKEKMLAQNSCESMTQLIARFYGGSKLQEGELSHES